MEEGKNKEETTAIHVGNRLKQYRKDENVKAVTVARILGITRQHYSIIENNKDMKFSMLLKVCTGVGLPLSYFLIDSDYENLSTETDEQIIECRTKLMKVQKTLEKLLNEL